MAHALFLQPEYRWISAQGTVFKNLNAWAGDKLAVENDQFVLSPGGFSQPFTRLYRNCLKGGHNRDAVVAHFEKVCARVDAFVQNLRAQPDYLNLPETRALAKTVYLLRTGASDVELSYRDPWAISDQTPFQLSAVFKRLDQVSKQLNAELRLDENSLQPIPFNMPPDQTVGQTVALAKKAIPSTADKVKALACLVFYSFLWPIALFLTLSKWVLWNPIEFAVRGKVTTQNLVQWVYSNAFRHDRINTQRGWQVTKYATQLLAAPVISEQHVAAFLQIASLKKDAVKQVSLFGASTIELFCPPLHFIALPTFLKLISSLSAIPSCKEVFIPGTIMRLDPQRFPETQGHFAAVDEALRKAGFKRKPDFPGIYIRA